MAELADAHGSATVTSVKNRGKSVHPHPVVRAGPKKAKKVANADMAELADAHGSAPVTSVTGCFFIAIFPIAIPFVSY